MSRLDAFLSPAGEVAGQLTFAYMLVVFMFVKMADVRNRMLLLVGAGRVTTEANAVDDASARISRYLLMQFLINASFGILATLGLLLLGMEQSALVWGFLAFLMRYVPYIGTWIGVIPPTLYALAMFDDVWRPFV